MFDMNACFKIYEIPDRAIKTKLFVSQFQNSFVEYRGFGLLFCTFICILQNATK